MSPSSRQAGRDTAAQKKKAPRPQKEKPSGPAGAEVTVPRATLVRRVVDARRAGMVVLAARAIGGGLITLLLTSAGYAFLGLFIGVFGSRLLTTPLSILTAAALVAAAQFACIKSVPEIAAHLVFLKEKAFLWVDPFRDDRPHFLPMWVDAILWAPTQVLAGAVPFKATHDAGAADAEAAADVARHMVEAGELDLTNGVDPASAESKGLKLLLLLRLARLLVEDGRLKGRVSGLGQAALFQGTVA